MDYEQASVVDLMRLDRHVIFELQIDGIEHRIIYLSDDEYQDMYWRLRLSISVARFVSSLDTKTSLFMLSRVWSNCSSDEKSSLKYFTLANIQS